MVQIFMSHTKLDRECCDKFDVAAARVGLKVFRSEFETIKNPAWATIREAVSNSSALFLLVGEKLVSLQASSETDVKAKEDWKFTQNWISYEIGLACQKGIDVWVVCDSTNLNFPVPYLNNYDIWGIRRELKQSMVWIREVFDTYDKGKSYPVIAGTKFFFACPSCGATFNLHSQLPENMNLTCPTCLNQTEFKKGWLLQSKPSSANQ